MKCFLFCYCSENRKKHSFFILTILIFFVAGCYSPSPLPEAVLSKEYKKLTREQHSSISPECNILSLDDAIRIALANNPDYRSAQHSVTAAWARLYATMSDYLPTISAEYDITEYKYVPMSSGGTGRDGGGTRRSQKTGGFRGNWEIFNGLVTTMRVLSDKERAHQNEALDRDSKRLLIRNVTYAYNNILLSMEKIRIASEDMAFNQSLLKDTEIKYEAGSVSLSEPLNFKVKVNEAKSALIDEKYELENTKFVLAELMGLTEGKLPENIKFAKIKETPLQLSDDIEIYLDSAIANRPDLEAYRKALEVARFEMWSRYGAFLPTISANSFWGYSRMDDNYSGRYKYRARTQDRSFNYGLSTEWVIFNGGKRIFNLREAQALLADAGENLTAHWIRVVSEVRQAYENYKRMIEQVKIRRETLELVKKTRDLVEEEYKAGNAPLTRLNEAQNDLVLAEGRLASAIISVENAKAQLNAAIGAF